MNLFTEMGLPEALNHKLTHMNFVNPTPIQAEAIPVAMSGKDIIGSAQTGTGKTGAFGIPLIAKLINDPNAHGIVITPTRELATQVSNQLRDMVGRKSSINMALLIGGAYMSTQIQQLKQKPRLVVCTPGRLMDHVKRGFINLSKFNNLVLDETDRMFDMGFYEQVKEILSKLPKNKQTLLFSATFPKKIVQIANDYLQDPIRIAVNTDVKVADNIQQNTINVKEERKFDALNTELEKREGSVVVFVKTKRKADEIAKMLDTEYQCRAGAIHGDLRQNKRERILKRFKDKKYRVLVATDVAARGIDIDHIRLVVNYDLPRNPEDYVHRVGRTARAGKDGHALNLVAPSERNLWDNISYFLETGEVRDCKESKSRGRGKPRSRGRGGNGGGSSERRRSDSSSSAPRRSRSGGSKNSRPRRDSKSSQGRKRKEER